MDIKVKYIQDILPFFGELTGAAVPDLKSDALRDIQNQSDKNQDMDPIRNQDGEPEIKKPLDDIYDQLINEMRSRQYASGTERAYLDWVRRFAKSISNEGGKSDPTTWTGGDVRAYLTRLAVVDRLSASTQNQALNALLLLFRNVLNQDLAEIRKTVRAKRGVRFPAILTQEEVRAVLGAADGEDRLILELIYGAGLRLMELAKLRVQDINFDAGTLFVRGGPKDPGRTTVLPKSVLDPLRRRLDWVKQLYREDLSKGLGEAELPPGLVHEYSQAKREWRWQYVFPSNRLSVAPGTRKARRHHLSGPAIQQIMERALGKAGVGKRATVQTLRNSFAAHLLMAGVNVRDVQGLLGHKSVETTLLYTRALRHLSAAPRSPLDTLRS